RSPVDLRHAADLDPQRAENQSGNAVPGPDADEAPSLAETPTFKSEDEIARYVQAIMDPGDTAVPRRRCPRSIGERYHGLRLGADREPDGPWQMIVGKPEPKIKYFFALNLKQVAHLLPRLMGTMVQVMAFLGPEYCALSVVEGLSMGDGTLETLQAMGERVEALGARFFLDRSALDPARAWAAGRVDQRYARLAKLRNQALVPLTTHPSLFVADPTIVFSNDISICPHEVLELVLQHQHQGADMSCGMDWVGEEAQTFYDSSMARSMTGDTFFEIPQSGNWQFRENLFWDDPPRKAQYERREPVQVYSCWNGIAAFQGAPIIAEELHFRGPAPDECTFGEPLLFCMDLWRMKRGKIQIVPTVNVAYTDEIAALVATKHGLIEDHVDVNDPTVATTMNWTAQPPGQLKCLPEWNQPSWVAPI
ncbi:MAG: hypothetical protein M1838_000273, partial [Thelocarpon superellum]